MSALSTNEEVPIEIALFNMLLHFVGTDFYYCPASLG